MSVGSHKVKNICRLRSGRRNMGDSRSSQCGTQEGCDYRSRAALSLYTTRFCWATLTSRHRFPLESVRNREWTVLATQSACGHWWPWSGARSFSLLGGAFPESATACHV